MKQIDSKIINKVVGNLVNLVEINRSKKDWSKIISFILLPILISSGVLLALIQRSSKQTPQPQILSAEIDTVSETGDITPLVYPRQAFTQSRVTQNNNNTWEAEYLYDFNNDGNFEKVNVIDEKPKSMEQQGQLLLTFRSGDKFFNIPHHMMGEVNSVFLWKPYDIVVIQVAIGQYWENYFFGLDDKLGLKEIPIVEGEEKFYSLQGNVFNDFIEISPNTILKGGVISYFFSNSPSCGDTADIYQLAPGPDPILYKAWSIQETDQDCKYHAGT